MAWHRRGREYNYGLGMVWHGTGGAGNITIRLGMVWHGTGGAGNITMGMGMVWHGTGGAGNITMGLAWCGMAQEGQGI